MNLQSFTFKTLCIVVLVISGVNIHAEEVTTKRVLWEKRPIPFALTVGKERIAHFPMEVRYWIPSSIEDALSILSVNGVLYLTALREFEKARIRVQSLNSQHMYLLDLSASDDETYTDELIVMDSEFVERKSASPREDAPQGDWFVRLTRFAALSLYAPERLMPTDSDITAVRLAASTPIALVRGGDIEAIPIKSWRGGGYYVTAVRLRNVSEHDIILAYSGSQVNRLLQRTVVLSEDIRGNWIAVTPQHASLEPAGHNDITTIYLLSYHAFSESF